MKFKEYVPVTYDDRPPSDAPRAMTTAEFLATRASMQPPAIETVSFAGNLRKFARRILGRGPTVTPVDGPILNTKEDMLARRDAGHAVAAAVADEYRWRPSSYLPSKQLYIQLRMLYARLAAEANSPLGIVGRVVGAVALYFALMWGSGISGLEALVMGEINTFPTGLVAQEVTSR